MSTIDRTDDPTDGEAPASSLLLGNEGCLGTFLSSGFGCLAFLLGSAAAIGLFGAHLLSGWGARAVEQVLSSRLDAEVRVDDVDLSWGKRQRIGSITVLGPDGSTVAQLSAEVPSLLALLDPDGRALHLSLDVASIRARVGEDGVDDVQRALRSGEGGLLEGALRAMARGMEASGPAGLVSAEIVVREWSVEDRASDGGRGDVVVRDLVARGEVRDGRAELRLDQADVDWGGPDGARRVSAGLGLRAAGGDGAAAGAPGPVQLEWLRVVSGGLPLGRARSLGVLRRRPRPLQPRDGVPARLQGVALQAVVDELEAGASVDVMLAPNAGAGSTDGLITIRGPRLDLSLGARWKDGRLVPEPVSRGEPLRVRFRPGPRSESAPGSASGSPSAPAPASGLEVALGALLPERLAVMETSSAEWVFTCRNFDLPHAPLMALGGAQGHLDALAAASFDFGLKTATGRECLLEVQDAADRESLLASGHQITNVKYDAAQGGVVDSDWRHLSGNANGNTELELELPPIPAPGAPSEPVRMRIEAFNLPTDLLGAGRGLPVELRSLLPPNFGKVELDGLTLRGSRAGLSSQVQFDAYSGRNARFFGFVEGTVLHLPMARFDLPVRPGTSDRFLQRLLPWFKEIRPAEGARVGVATIGYAVDLASKSFVDRGGISLSIAGMEGALQDRLARDYFEVEPDSFLPLDQTGVQLDLADGLVRYRNVLLPLGEEEEPIVLEGRLDRSDNALSLGGLVETRMLRGVDDVGFLPVRITLAGPPEDLSLFIDTGYLGGYLGRKLQELRDMGLPGDR
ncbi:MAG: hypothetical protein PVJ89_06990 [Planctomycetota bacterium]